MIHKFLKFHQLNKENHTFFRKILHSFVRKPTFRKKFSEYFPAATTNNKIFEITILSNFYFDVNCSNFCLIWINQTLCFIVCIHNHETLDFFLSLYFSFLEQYQLFQFYWSLLFLKVVYPLPLVFVELLVSFVYYQLILNYLIKYLQYHRLILHLLLDF